MIPAQSFAAWQVATTALHCIALACSLLRGWHRWRTHGLWWDDYFAAPAFLMSIVQIVVIWMFFVEVYPNEDAQKKNVLFWILSLSWFILIWTCRISLALSVARVFPAWGTPRRFSLGLALGFGITFAGLLSWQLTIHCENSGLPMSTTKSFLHCNSNRAPLIIMTIITDIISEILLIASPCYMLWRVRLPTSQRRLVLTLFSASALTLFASILYAICNYSSWVTGPGALLISYMSAQIEAAISLIVCNLLVCVTFFYRMLHKDSHEPDVIDSKVGQYPEPTLARAHRPMNVTVITLTEVAKDGRRKYLEEREDQDQDDDWSANQSFPLGVKDKGEVAPVAEYHV